MGAADHTTAAPERAQKPASAGGAVRTRRRSSGLAQAVQRRAGVAGFVKLIREAFDITNAPDDPADIDFRAIANRFEAAVITNMTAAPGPWREGFLRAASYFLSYACDDRDIRSPDWNPLAGTARAWHEEPAAGAPADAEAGHADAPGDHDFAADRLAQAAATLTLLTRLYGGEVDADERLPDAAALQSLRAVSRMLAQAADALGTALDGHGRQALACAHEARAVVGLTLSTCWFREAGELRRGVADGPLSSSLWAARDLANEALRALDGDALNSEPAEA